MIRREPLVELRSDLMALSPEELAEILPLAERAIVTCHTADTTLAERIYSVAIEQGAWAVDIAYTTQQDLRAQLIGKAHQAGTQVILSHHYSTTPTLEELQGLAERLFAEGCDIAKIITTATSTAEALTPLGLYEHFEAGKIIAFAMGEAGSFSRRASLLLGAPHTYAAPTAEERTALGQPTIEELRESLRCGEPLEGYTLPHSITPPSSKSEAQRAIMLATLATGSTTIENYTPCGDTLAAERVAESLGAKISRPTPHTLQIEGIGAEVLRQRAQEHPTTLEVGESALLARMALPIVALLVGRGTIAGCGTLLSRLLAGDVSLLERYGAECKSNNGAVPIEILSGAEVTTEIEIEGSHSSQSTTGWLIALGAMGGRHTLRVANATSRPYIALTAKMLEQFGAQVTICDKGEDLTIEITSEGYRPTSLRLSVDWSGAAYFATAYAIAQSGLRPAKEYILHAHTSTPQADEAIVEILLRAGARIEPCSEGLRFLPSEGLRAFGYDATHTPDLIPTLAVLALFAEGRSHIGGLHRLANKESNRTEAMVENLVALGARVAIEGDELVIEGGIELRPAPLRSYSDHRVAMSLAVASLFMDPKPTIDTTRCVAKSYPDFFEQLRDKTL